MSFPNFISIDGLTPSILLYVRRAIAFRSLTPAFYSLARTSWAPETYWNVSITSFQNKRSNLHPTYADVFAWLLLCVCDLSVINDDGVASSAVTHGPADGLGECGLVVAKE